MKHFLTFLFFVGVFICTFGQAQQKITKQSLKQIQKNVIKKPVLDDKDSDFLKSPNSLSKWDSESAIILLQKTNFVFDRDAPGIGTKIFGGIGSVLAAPITFGMTLLYFKNERREVAIIVEETERRKILLKDRFAVDQFSIIYFRYGHELDAFSARVIKKNGAKKEIDLTDAVLITENDKIPSTFAGYTDGANDYGRDTYYKLAIPDLEEGDVLEYAFRHYNSQTIFGNDKHFQFRPIYYQCNREMPIENQIIEVAFEDKRYYLASKSLKNAPEFKSIETKKNRIYRWEDSNRGKLTDTRYVNEAFELPSVKFQVLVVRNSFRKNLLFESEADMQRDINLDVLGEKSWNIWYKKGKEFYGDEYAKRYGSEAYKELDEFGVVDMSDQEFVDKSYFYLRHISQKENWNDFRFAKVFAWLIEKKKLPYEVVVTYDNQRTNIAKLAFTREMVWAIKFNGKIYPYPDGHYIPGDIPEWIEGNNAITFSGNTPKEKSVSNMLVTGNDTIKNVQHIAFVTSMNVDKNTIDIVKTVEDSGYFKFNELTDVLYELLYWADDYKNFNAPSRWGTLKQKKAGVSENRFLEEQKKNKEVNLKHMQSRADEEYEQPIEKYESPSIIQDGRGPKNKSLKYEEKFTLGEISTTAGQDLVVALPSLIGGNTQIKKDERIRTAPIDVRYPRTLHWTINFTIPTGYEVKGIEGLSKTVQNAVASFVSTAKIANGILTIDATKKYKVRNLPASQWSQLLEMLDAAYDYSQSKIVLRKI
jgi:hypothetical protein